jgi:ATP-dependent DNA helicase RecG
VTVTIFTKWGLIIIKNDICPTLDTVFVQPWIQCGWFIGKDKADIFYHIEIHEHLPVAVERAMEFLKKHAIARSGFFRTQAQGRLEHSSDHPEGSSNQCCCPHRLLTKGCSYQDCIFDNRIEIENPGILLPGMTVEDMRQGVSKIRNHVIARVIFHIKKLKRNRI